MANLDLSSHFETLKGLDGRIYIPIAIAGLYVFYSIASALLSPLRSVPGPFLARFSRLWYLVRVAKGGFHYDNIKLHQQYGRIVRIAPNQYSLNDPDAVRLIYGHGAKLFKSKWYTSWAHPSSPDPDTFTVQDPAVHATARRKVASLFSNTNLLKLEPFVDECIEALVGQFQDICRRKQDIDLQFWMQSYAFDVIGLITCGKSFGFIQAGKDKEGMFSSLHNYLTYGTNVGIFPEFHKTLFSLYVMSGLGGMEHIVRFAKEQIDEHKKATSEQRKPVRDGYFLSRLFQMHEEDPEKITTRDVFITCASNIGAGSDTTAISLCAVLYYVIKHPDVLLKLREEIDEHTRSDPESKIAVSFHQAQQMPYLQACIKEAMRLHPATGLPLARVVPKGGMEISGKYFPEGSVVGINTWVAHRNKDVFGPDATSFRPERWLEASKEQLSVMDGYYFPFGHGSRTCLGKNISLMEMNKLIPALFKRFDIRLVNPKAEMECQNVWFVKPTNLLCRVEERQ